jgi:uncharacterized protein YciI
MTRFFVRMATGLLLLMPFPAAATEPTSPAAAQEKLFLVQFSLGPAWTAGKPPQEQPKFEEHGANLKRLRDDGKIVLGARYSDKGMVVLRFASEAQARTEMAADPGVQAGTFTFEVFELRPFYDGCLAREPVQGAPAR